MGINGPETTPGRPAGLRLVELGGLVAGYSLAAVLIRSFQPADSAISFARGVALCLFYGWLGLAMSGPLVLLVDRHRTESGASLRGEEMAWVGIGGYFLALTLLVVPARARETPWSVILLIQAIVACVVLVWLPAHRRRRRDNASDRPRWTVGAAGFLVMTWPVAWILLVLLLR